MSPPPLYDVMKNNKNTMCPPPAPLKISKESHMINKKKTNATAEKILKQSQQRRPVIIYTQMPRVIHTKPAEFMALVQKLTGMPKQADDIPAAQITTPKLGLSSPNERDSKSLEKTESHSGSNGDAATSSASSDGNSNWFTKNETVNPCFGPPMYEPTLGNPYITNIPIFNTNPASFYMSDQSINSYPDPLFWSPDASSSITTLEDIAEL